MSPAVNYKVTTRSLKSLSGLFQSLHCLVLCRAQVWVGLTVVWLYHFACHLHSSSWWVSARGWAMLKRVTLLWESGNHRLRPPLPLLPLNWSFHCGLEGSLVLDYSGKKNIVHSAQYLKYKLVSVGVQINQKKMYIVRKKQEEKIWSSDLIRIYISILF